MGPRSDPLTEIGVYLILRGEKIEENRQEEYFLRSIFRIMEWETFVKPLFFVFSCALAEDVIYFSKVQINYGKPKRHYSHGRNSC